MMQKNRYFSSIFLWKKAGNMQSLIQMMIIITDTRKNMQIANKLCWEQKKREIYS